MRPYASDLAQVLADANEGFSPLWWLLFLLAGAALVIWPLARAVNKDRDPTTRRRAATEQMAFDEHLRDQRHRLRDELDTDRARDARRELE